VLALHLLEELDRLLEATLIQPLQANRVQDLDRTLFILKARLTPASADTTRQNDGRDTNRNDGGDLATNGS